MMKGMHKWLILLAGFMIMLAAGLVFSWSIFVEPIEQDLGFLRSQTSLVFPISLSVSILGQMVAGVFAAKNKIRWNFIATAILCGSGFFLAGRIQNVAMLIISYGILVGLAIGMMYNGVLATAVLHFGHRADAAAGVLLLGFGMGSMVFGAASATLIQAIGWRSAFAVLGIIFSALSLLGAFVIVRPGEYKSKEILVSGNQTTTRQMIRDRRYILTFSWITVLVSTYLVISGHAALCVSDIGASPYLAGIAIGVVSMSNVAARVVVSAVSKYFGTARTQYLLTLIGIVSSVVCLFGYRGQIFGLMMIGYALLGFLNGGCTIVINSYIMNEFGNQNFAMNMAVTNVHLAVASALGPAVAGFLKTRSGTYTPAFAAMILMGGAAFVLLRMKEAE